MPFLLIAIDAQTMQAGHFTLPNQTMLYSAGWGGPMGRQIVTIDAPDYVLYEQQGRQAQLHSYGKVKWRQRLPQSNIGSISKAPST